MIKLFILILLIVCVCSCRILRGDEQCQVKTIDVELTRIDTVVRWINEAEVKSLLLKWLDLETGGYYFDFVPMGTYSVGTKDHLKLVTRIQF